VPYIAGKRVTLDEWRAHQPVRPLVRYDVDGGRKVVNEAEVEAAQHLADAETWARNENLRRAGLILTDHLDVPMVSAADYVGPEDATTVEVMTRKRSDSMRIAVIADALGLAPDDEQRADIDVIGGREYTPGGIVLAIPVEHEPVERGPTTHAREQEFAASNGFESKATRHSQTPEGRRERLIRFKAKQLGISYEEAEARTPRGRGGRRVSIKDPTPTTHEENP